MLDCFDASVMQEYIDSPYFNEEGLEGFVFYPNTVGGATRTEIAVPYLLSGIHYEGNESNADYIARVYAKNRLLPELKRLGYQNYIFASSGFCAPQSAESVVNVHAAQLKASNNLALLLGMYKLGLYQYSMQWLKPLFWTYPKEMERFKATQDSAPVYAVDDRALYEEILKGVTVNDGAPTFRFYQLEGAHAPYRLDENMNPVEESSELRQAAGSMLFVATLCQQLREAGVLDRTTVIVLADHGFYNLEQNPLLMVKPAGGSGAFAVDRRPLDYYDLIPTVLSIASGGALYQGETIYDVEEGQVRERDFYRNITSNNQFGVEKYVTTALDASDAGAFHLVETLRSQIEAPQLDTNAELVFTAAGNASAYCTGGFSKAEETHTWSNDDRSVLDFEWKKQVKHDVVMQVQVVSVVDNMQEVRIYVNDQLADTLTVTDANHQFDVVIPKALMNGKKMNIRFEYSGAHGNEHDGRKLAMAFKRISFRKK